MAVQESIFIISKSQISLCLQQSDHLIDNNHALHNIGTASNAVAVRRAVHRPCHQVEVAANVERSDVKAVH